MATTEQLKVELSAEVMETLETLGRGFTAAQDAIGKLATKITDAVRRIDGIATELSKTNARLDDVIADRAKHQHQLDQRLEEIMEATQEAEKAFLVRIEKAEKLANAYAQRNANLVRDLRQANGEDD